MSNNKIAYVPIIHVPNISRGNIKSTKENWTILGCVFLGTVIVILLMIRHYEKY